MVGEIHRAYVQKGLTVDSGYDKSGEHPLYPLESAMKLLTKEIRKQLPKLYSTENVPTEEKVAVVKFFMPSGRGTWYGVEFDGEDIFFGYVVSPLGPDMDEWGNFSLTELMSLRGQFNLGIERDYWFQPQPIQPLIDAAKR